MNHEGFGVKAKLRVSAKALRWEREERRERGEDRGKEREGEEGREEAVREFRSS